MTRLNKLVKVVNGVRVGRVVEELVDCRVKVLFDTYDGPVVRTYDWAELQEVKNG